MVLCSLLHWRLVLAVYFSNSFGSNSAEIYPACTFPRYLTRFSSTVQHSSSFSSFYPHFLLGQTSSGKSDKDNVFDSTEAWVTEVHHDSQGHLWRSHKEILFAKNGGEMVVLFKSRKLCDKADSDHSDRRRLSRSSTKRHLDSTRLSRLRLRSYDLAPNKVIINGKKICDVNPSACCNIGGADVADTFVLNSENETTQDVMGRKYKPHLESSLLTSRLPLSTPSTYPPQKLTPTKQTRFRPGPLTKNVDAEKESNKIKTSGDSATSPKVLSEEAWRNKKFKREHGEDGKMDEGDVCYEREVLLKRTCQSQVGPNKFVVIHHSRGSTQATCIKFVPRNQNIVHIFQGPHDEDSTDVCPDHLLQREEWPLFSPYQREVSFCPLVGGFDFRTTSKNHGELCPQEWRPSRLEVECVKGEGMTLTFVDPSCSPFYDKRLRAQMKCWGSWEEGGFVFIAAAPQEDGGYPRYIFRYEQVYKSQPVSSMKMYFSPITPVTDLTRFSNVVHLSLNKSEPGVCYDDSWTCAEHARLGRCVNGAMFHYANFCKRSCGLCNLIPPWSAECHFNSDIRKEWRYYAGSRREDITISQDNITFSSLGTFLCKSKHWEKNYYKLFSYYNNGCRPRYTCLHLVETSNRVLNFQISTSSIEDQSFTACNDFKDDTPPLNDSIRSRNLKSIVASDNFQDSTCGLSGSIDVITRGDDDDSYDDRGGGNGRNCRGTVSDWSKKSCGSLGRLKITLMGHCPTFALDQLDDDGDLGLNDSSATRHGDNQDLHDLMFDRRNVSVSGSHVRLEFSCSSYYVMDHMHATLVTRTTGKSGNYLCWGIILDPRASGIGHRTNLTPWKEIFLMESTQQCGTMDQFDPFNLAQAMLSLKVDNRALHRPCQQLPTPSFRNKVNHGERDRKYSSHDHQFTPRQFVGNHDAEGRASPVHQSESGRPTGGSTIMIMMTGMLFGFFVPDVKRFTNVDCL